MATDLCKLGELYKVDKCPAFKNHYYTPEYDALFSSIRKETKLVLEIGIGNIPLMASLTSQDYKPGASLRMWRDYFPNAEIVGCDILPDVQFTDDRIRTFVTDQSQVPSLETLAQKVGIHQRADIIIDDGSHVEDHMVLTFKTLWKLLKTDGIYVIEDIRGSILDRITHLHQECGFIDAEILQIYKGVSYWDNFVAFRKTSPLESIRRPLVYFSLFFNKGYLKLLKILLTSIKLNSRYDGIAFLVLTSEELQSEIVQMGALIGVPLQIHLFETTDVFGASASKCRIFEVPTIHQYTHLLYLDLDVLVTRDLATLFDNVTDDVLYGIEDGRMDHPGNGGWLYTKDTCQNPTEVPAINAGVLLFPNTPAIKTIMTECYRYMIEKKKRGDTMPSCLEQPFVNYFFYKEGRLNSQMLKDYGYLHKGEDSNERDYTLVHFIAPIGVPGPKYTRMATFFSKSLFGRETDTSKSQDVVHGKYQWSNFYNGWIVFEPDGRLNTTWGGGTYTWFSDHSLCARFAGLEHFLQFDAPYSTFLSIRNNDCDVIKGRKQ